MKNPNTARVVMYIILFIGFGIVIRGTASAQPNVHRALHCIGIIVVIAAFAYGINFVRCPYCDGLLNLKMCHTHKCPHCGADID